MSDNPAFSAEQIKNMLEKKGLPTDIENISNINGFGEGIQLFEKAKYLEALEVFSKLIGQQEHDLIRMYLGVCHYRLESFETAYRHFSQLIQSEGRTKEIASSMLAAIEIEQGNVEKAIKILRTLPPTTHNLINLSLVYWKRYENTKEEFSIREALRILNTIDTYSIGDKYCCKVYHLKALIYQEQNDFLVAQDFYRAALESVSDPIDKGIILNDLASLWVKLGDYERAEDVLNNAGELLLGKNKLGEAFYHKWMGHIALHQKEWFKAKMHFEKASIFIKEKNLMENLALVSFWLAKSFQCKDFYKAADLYADGLTYEHILENATNDNVRILRFYSSCFFDNEFG